jgi:hypothetical protein
MLSVIPQQFFDAVAVPPVVTTGPGATARPAANYPSPSMTTRPST